MYPDLSYLFHDLFGTQTENWLSVFKTFGVFLAFAFLASAFVLYRELKRKEKEGIFHPQNFIQIYTKDAVVKESLFNGFLIGFLCFKLPFIIDNWDLFKSNPASIVFNLKGNILTGLLGGIALAAFNYYKGMQSPSLNERKEIKVYPSSKISDITVVTAISGIFGARLFSIFENMDAFLKDPIGQLLSGSGLTVYGGLIVGFIGGYWYVRKLGMHGRHAMDACAPAMVMGQLVGRMGCQFSGDGDWGIVNTAPKPSWFALPDWAWVYDYPRNVLQRGEKMTDCIGEYCNHLVPGVYPTPIYEVTGYAITFAILWFLRKRIKTAGVLFFIFMVLSGIVRFFVEDLRVNDTYELLGFNWSFSKYIAVGIIVVGLAGITWLLQKSKPTLEQEMP